jgi:hypothetical protein
LGYVLTRKSVVPQVSNEKIYRKGAHGLTWGYDPVRKDRLSVKPVVWNDNEWVFDENGSRYEQCAPIRGEWGQIQSRHILSEADMSEISSEQQAEKDADRLAGHNCDSLAREAFEFYANHLERTSKGDPETNQDDARILREFNNYKWLGKGYR